MSKRFLFFKKKFKPIGNPVGFFCFIFLSFCIIFIDMSLRKTIRTILESVLVESEGKSVTCQNCFHSWDIKKSDDSPYFCHCCGYDNKNKDFDLEKLKSWMKNYYK